MKKLSALNIKKIIYVDHSGKKIKVIDVKTIHHGCGTYTLIQKDKQL